MSRSKGADHAIARESAASLRAVSRRGDQVGSQVGPPPESDLEARDAEHMEAVACGDEEALQALMDRHWGGLIRYARRMRLSEDEASDVAQEVFVRVWEHRARWTRGGSPQGYLYRIARRMILESFRRRAVRIRSRGRLEALAGSVETPFETTAGHELEAAIEQAIAALPERRREAFVLVRIEGLGLRAAAEAMGLARQTVANHVHLAVQDLQRALGPFLA